VSGASVDAVVVAYNSRATLHGCVAPLAGLDWVSVTVVDNASPEDSLPAVAGLPIRTIRSEHNGGFSSGCNLGMGGDGDYVLLLNPDARLDERSLAVMAEALDADPEVGAVGPRTLGMATELLWTQRRFPRLRSTFAQALFLHRLFPRAGWSDELVRDPGAYDAPAEPDWLSGACLLIRRAALEEIGGLDERFFLYCEDTDLFRRLRTAGWRARYEPGATAQHEGGASSEHSTSTLVEAQSRVRYARKHHGPATAVAEACGVALGALTHAAVWIHRPRRARAHGAAARAAFGALRSSEARG
jgi:N-acetylglucosaminyl-diphospho-decaprenol L-rhamnosyltransferase